MEQFTFTVGKLDAGMAILIGERAHLIEFPSLLLPPGVTAGSIVNIAVNRNVSAEQTQLKEFWSLQDAILQEYGLEIPRAPVLKLRHTTQTSVTLEWDPLFLATAKCRGLEIYKNGNRLALIPNPLTNTSTKLSSLQSNEEYTFHLVLKTTAGTFQSNVIRVRTHTMKDTSGISVCFGNVEDEKMLIHAKQALEQMNAKWTDKVQIDTTHFVCTTSTPSNNNVDGGHDGGGSGPGAEYQKAVQLSLPIVQPQWILACQHERRLMPIAHFQLGVPVAAYSTSEPPPFVRPPSSPNTPTADRRNSILAEQQAQSINRARSPETSARARIEDQAKTSTTSNNVGEEENPSADQQASPAGQQQQQRPEDDGADVPIIRPKSTNEGRLDRNFRMPTGTTPPASAKTSSEENSRAKEEVVGTPNLNEEAKGKATVHGKTASEFTKLVQEGEEVPMPPLPPYAEAAEEENGTNVAVEDDKKEVPAAIPQETSEPENLPAQEEDAHVLPNQAIKDQLADDPAPSHDEVTIVRTDDASASKEVPFISISEKEPIVGTTEDEQVVSTVPVAVSGSENQIEIVGKSVPEAEAGVDAEAEISAQQHEVKPEVELPTAAVVATNGDEQPETGATAETESELPTAPITLAEEGTKPTPSEQPEQLQAHLTSISDVEGGKVEGDAEISNDATPADDEVDAEASGETLPGTPIESGAGTEVEEGGQEENGIKPVGGKKNKKKGKKAGKR